MADPDIAELLAMRMRAERVLTNGTTSGSARRMAEDMLYLTNHILSKKKAYLRAIARKDERARANKLIDDLESQFE